ncbi:MAG: ribulose-phosphate 3-epimerase [Bacteroidales bacterium]|nr:ribulose-phosphate 3-epimerase [Bacteroidales bacterium]
MSRYVSPSILAADFSVLGSEIEKVNNSLAGWIHCDVMDGVFVPNISFGFPIVEAVARHASKPLDVHLMIVEPSKYIDRFCSLGIDILTIHQEASKYLQRAVFQIKEHGVKAGVSLSPHTPVSVLSEVMADLDLVLVMSVNPGFGGQSFIESTYRRVGEVRELILKTRSKALIQVDGGITLDNAARLFESGANILVTGTTVFKSTDPAAIIERMLTI